MPDASDQRFFRGNDRILGGVCSGLAEGFHVDPMWVRIVFVVLVFLQGVGLFLYIVLWLVLPERVEGGARRSGFDSMMADVNRVWGELRNQFGGTASRVSPGPAAPQPASPQPSPGAAAPTAEQATAAPAVTSQRSRGLRNPSVLVGVVLVAIGVIVLGNNVGIINWSVVWPAALITIGIVILVRNMERTP